MKTQLERQNPWDLRGTQIPWYQKGTNFGVREL